MVLEAGFICYKLGKQDEQIRQIQNVVFLGDPDKEEERTKKKWLSNLLIEAQKEGLIVEVPQEKLKLELPEEPKEEQNK